MWTCIAHHFPGFWNKKERCGQKEDFQGKKKPTQPFHFPRAVRFWLQKLSFPRNKRALSPPSAFSLLQPGTQAGGSPPWVGGMSPPTRAWAGSHSSENQPWAGPPRLPRITWQNLKPTLCLRETEVSLFSGASWQAEQMWPGYIMQIGWFRRAN